MANYRTVTVKARVSDMTIRSGVKLSTPVEYSPLPHYNGAYEVTPDWHTQTLATRNRQMTDDVTVKSIQLELVSNLSGGKTAYIGGIING